MEAIKIGVSKQMDGYTFSIGPGIRQMIRSWFPEAHPANNIFVGYDTNSNFEVHFGKLETFIYPALLGIDSQTDLNKKVKEIQFIDTKTDRLLLTQEISS